MSLKAFHLFFIAVSIVLAVGFGTWAVQGYRAEGGAQYLAWIAFAAASAIGLAFYEVTIVKKFKKAGI